VQAKAKMEFYIPGGRALNYKLPLWIVDNGPLYDLGGQRDFWLEGLSRVLTLIKFKRQQERRNNARHHQN
jgi:hypothetical protein